MGFNAKILGNLWLAVLLCSVAAAADAEHLVTVLVNNSAGVPASVLLRAEAEAEGVLAAAGIDVEWVHCSETSWVSGVCRLVPGVNQLVLQVVTNGKTSSDSVYGEAFLGADGSGKYCDVFFGRIESDYRDAGINVAQLLGAVAAHELGHLLLGSHSHSQVGIMEPVWRSESLRQIGMGTLLFTPQESRRMKSRIGGETARATMSDRQSLRTADSSGCSRVVGKNKTFWTVGLALSDFSCNAPEELAAKGYGNDPSLRGRTP
jgi:hypothetical protein